MSLTLLCENKRWKRHVRFVVHINLVRKVGFGVNINLIGI